MAMKFFQVDAFSSRPFAGNPAAVMPLKEWLPDEMLAAIAAEHNLAETAYFVPQGQRLPSALVHADGRDAAVRACDPRQRVRRAQSSAAGPGQGRVPYACRAPLTVARDGDRLIMDFPTRKNEPASVSELAPVAEAIGAKVIDLRRSWTYLAVVESEDVVRDLKPDISKIARLPLDVDRDRAWRQGGLRLARVRAQGRHPGRPGDGRGALRRWCPIGRRCWSARPSSRASCRAAAASCGCASKATG